MKELDKKLSDERNRFYEDEKECFLKKKRKRFSRIYGIK